MLVQNSHKNEDGMNKRAQVLNVDGDGDVGNS